MLPYMLHEPKKICCFLGSFCAVFVRTFSSNVTVEKRRVAILTTSIILVAGWRRGTHREREPFFALGLRADGIFS